MMLEVCPHRCYENTVLWKQVLNERLFIVIFGWLNILKTNIWINVWHMIMPMCLNEYEYEIFIAQISQG